MARGSHGVTQDDQYRAAQLSSRVGRLIQRRLHLDPGCQLHPDVHCSSLGQIAEFAEGNRFMP